MQFIVRFFVNSGAICSMLIEVQNLIQPYSLQNTLLSMTLFSISQCDGAEVDNGTCDDQCCEFSLIKEIRSMVYSNRAINRHALKILT